jgi:tetratricopeptide (TPR) repeat protein
MLGAGPSVEERLEQCRNLGKAFYENPTTANEAVAEFKKALDLAPDSNREKLNYALALLHSGKAEEGVALLKDVQTRDPNLPHTWFNLGLYYRRNGDAELAQAQFERMLQLTPGEPIAHYQLGAIYRQLNKNNEAAAQFEQAAKLDPQLAGAHFQLYNLYRQTGRAADAARELATFQALKKQQEGAAVPEDVDWCGYAEIYDPPRAAVSAAAEPAPAYDDRILPGAVDAKTAGLLAIDAAGKGRTDLLVWSARGVALYRDGVTLVADAGLGDLKGVIDIAAGDFDNDGLMDLCVLTEAGPQLYRNTGGRFAKFAADLPQRRFDRGVWIDYDHDYDLDLVLLGDAPALLRNQGSAGFADRTADFPFVKGAVTGAYKLRVVPDSKAFDLAVFYNGRAPVIYRDELGGHYRTEAYDGAPRDATQLDADFDGDGKPDRVRVSTDGAVHFMRNRTRSNRHWIRVQLAGVKSLKTGQDAQVEIKAGLLFRKRMYEGVPLEFDVGGATDVDVVRITWMNGLIQNETRQAANKTYRYVEAQRLSGSCPMIWTWNGREHEFITDVLGVAPLGASDGDGSYFPVDHDEYVSIPGRALVPVDGIYDVRITEELSEVSYLDQVELYAVDHPGDTQIFTNEKFKSPPYPEFRLFGVKRRVYPVAAHDDKGRDVLASILKTDAKYPDGFARTESGVAEMHALELDFGNAARDGRATLLLHGWVDWPDGSTFRAASQESKAGLVLPRLEMQDAAGRWQTVNPDMGIPAGKPKTIAVDVRFLSASRKLRIVTNLCVYWDEIFLSEETGAPAVEQRMAALESANLHFRGFSRARIDAARRQPDTYSYAGVSATSFWNPTPGLYTRYGNVRELIGEVDDRMVVMGSGDELALRFSAAAFPPLKAGWTRDYLLKVDGWAKDRDPNTAFSTAVEPLPFHAMSVYPYPKNEVFPDDAAHEKYRREYNTRPALRLIRPLSD